jgi:hypothetical protein
MNTTSSANSNEPERDESPNIIFIKCVKCESFEYARPCVYCPHCQNSIYRAVKIGRKTRTYRFDCIERESKSDLSLKFSLAKL